MSGQSPRTPDETLAIMFTEPARSQYQTLPPGQQRHVDALLDHVSRYPGTGQFGERDERSLRCGLDLNHRAGHAVDGTVLQFFVMTWERELIVRAVFPDRQTYTAHIDELHAQRARR
ncbi:hypothetical protein ABZ410_15510 [Streptomyces cinnamoneus]|uniref:hypothetical protein n=1 Tax=Streptomyces cinnamoneus TaxID=53446 RepID=UPI003405AA30